MILDKTKLDLIEKEIKTIDIKNLIKEHINTAPLANIEYVEIVDQLTMQPVNELAEPVMIAMAVRFKTTRLIDNILLG